MIDHVWSVVCSHAVIDKESNNVSLHNVIEQLVFEKPDIPEDIDPDRVIIPQNFSVVTLWSRTDLEKGVIGYGRVKLYSPTNEMLLSSDEFEIDLYNHRRFRSRGRFPGIVNRGPGKYIISVELRIDEGADWSEVARVPIEVRASDQNES